MLRREKQLSVFLENKPGQLADLCGILAEANINIRAVSVVDTVEHGLVRLLVDQPDKAREKAQEAGFNFLEAEVLTVKLPDRPGILAELARLLGNAGLNIQYLYGSTTEIGQPALVVLRVLDIDRAEEVLTNWQAS